MIYLENIYDLCYVNGWSATMGNGIITVNNGDVRIAHLVNTGEICVEHGLNLFEFSYMNEEYKETITTYLNI